MTSEMRWCLKSCLHLSKQRSQTPDRCLDERGSPQQEHSSVLFTRPPNPSGLLKGFLEGSASFSGVSSSSGTFRLHDFFGVSSPFSTSGTGAIASAKLSVAAMFGFAALTLEGLGGCGASRHPTAPPLAGFELLAEEVDNASFPVVVAVWEGMLLCAGSSQATISKLSLPEQAYKATGAGVRSYRLHRFGRNLMPVEVVALDLQLALLWMTCLDQPIHACSFHLPPSACQNSNPFC